MDNVIFIYTTCKDKQEAKKLAKILVREKLAGCVTFFPVESFFFWGKKFQEAKEFVLLFKTYAKNFSKIEKRITALHSYDTPCIVSWPVEKVSKKYLKWLIEQID